MSQQLIGQPASLKKLPSKLNSFEGALNTPLLLEVFPTTICMLINTILILINVYHNKRSENQLFGMGLGTIFSNIVGYLLISSLNIGLACEIAKANMYNKFRIIGIYYQRALVVNFIVCIIVITPLLYISNKILYFYTQMASSEILITTSQYLFQLVPSIYSFTFFDTTRVYLQSQYLRIPPMLILFCAIFFHYYISEILIRNIPQKGMGAAWSKNFTDILCAAIIYIYARGVAKKTWIEWNMQCLTNWNRHIEYFKIIGLTTYLEAFMFLIFSLLGYRLSKAELSAHVSYVNWTQILFLIFLGYKQGLLTQISELIIKKQYLAARSKVKSGIQASLIFSLIVNFLVAVYKPEASTFFLSQNEEASLISFNSCFWIFILSNLIDSVQITIAGILKVIDNTHAVLKTSFCCYLAGLWMSYYLAYEMEMHLKGLWLGWMAGIACNLLISMYYLRKQFRVWAGHLRQPSIQMQSLPL